MQGVQDERSLRPVDLDPQARQPGVDPYRLDADGDGVGCDG